MTTTTSSSAASNKSRQSNTTSSSHRRRTTNAPLVNASSGVDVKDVRRQSFGIDGQSEASSSEVEATGSAAIDEKKLFGEPSWPTAGGYSSISAFNSKDYGTCSIF